MFTPPARPRLLLPLALAASACCGQTPHPTPPGRPTPPGSLAEGCTCGNGRLKLWGPGGPHTALVPAALLFNDEAPAGQPPVEICWGPEATWREAALQCGAGLFAGAEQQMGGFLRVYSADSAAVAPITMHASVLIVRSGNPLAIAGLRDVIERPELRAVVNDGNLRDSLTSATALWEDVVGRTGSVSATERVRAKIVAFTAGSGEARDLILDGLADVWFSWLDWAVANPEGFELVPIEREFAIARDLSAVPTNRSADDGLVVGAFLDFLRQSPEANAVMELAGWFKEGALDSAHALRAARAAATGTGDLALKSDDEGDLTMAPESWCGVFDYKGFAAKSPLNISISGATADIAMVWDQKAHGCKHCCAESEDGLKVTRSATHISFQGDGTASDYYTFVGALNPSGDKMEGNITNSGRAYGTFAAQRNGCPATVKCTPSKPTPSPTPGPPRPPSPPLPPPPPAPPHEPVPVWPLPLKLECTKAVGVRALLSDSAAVRLSGPGAASSVATQAAARYEPLLRAAGSSAGLVSDVTVVVEEASDSLSQTTNYSYSLSHVSGRDAAVAVFAASPFGVGYAMESLLQLASPKARLDCAGFQLQDTPVYDHRGLLLDTGRRFYPLELVESTIDAMAMVKLNVLHLHLNENKFRVESRVFPQLNQPRNCSECGYYSYEDIGRIVQFAHARGVRVIPEFELLAHATILCDALKGEGVVCCGGKWGMGQLGDDPSGNSSRLINALLTEMTALFPDAVVHIGGGAATSLSPPLCCVLTMRVAQTRLHTTPRGHARSMPRRASKRRRCGRWLS